MNCFRLVSVINGNIKNIITSFLTKKVIIYIVHVFLITTFVVELQSRVCNLRVMKNYIQHPGVVESIDKNKVIVKITQKTSCSDCHAKSVCLSSDKKEKIIEIIDASGKYTLNEEVVISAQSSMGHLAVVLAFILPLVLVVVTLYTGVKISGNEGISGLIGLSVLVPYFFTLYILRDKLKKNFEFTLSKADTDD